ncbi:MAG: putative maturation protein [Alehxovirus infecundadaptatum]|uniref:Maturation protein n=1 Tax=Leviviridae sp. TaxID=2027243 RepID=A0ABY3STT3_9VIRU|nr:MAG: putative maturation protein [Leviviridae sp.]
MRYRELSFTRPPIGFRDFYSAGVFVNRELDQAVEVYFKHMTDEGHGKGQENPLHLDQFRGKIQPFNGTANGLYTQRCDYVNCLHGAFEQWHPDHLDITAPLSDGEYATQLLARTNPNRYALNGPVSVLELRDLPRMVKLAGDSILKNAAGGYLSWQFGWKPLLSDLRKLLDFNHLVDKKVGELEALSKAGGLHRKRTFGPGRGNSLVERDTHTDNILCLDFFGVRCFLDYRRTTHLEKWGTTKWYPLFPLPKDAASKRRLAKQIVFGLELSPANIWEAMPWSWLIDWYSNVGDYLSIYNNVVLVTHTPVCIMTRSTTQATFARTDHVTEIDGGNGSWTYQTKIRSIVSPTLNFGAPPFLTDRQLSILGSLAILRLPGGRH